MAGRDSRISYVKPYIRYIRLQKWVKITYTVYDYRNRTPSLVVSDWERGGRAYRVPGLYVCDLVDYERWRYN